MSKLPFFLFCALFISSSAFALSCSDGTSAGGCIDQSTSAEDCAKLGYSANEPDCEHYIYCPFNDQYKLCVKDKTTPPYDCASMQTRLSSYDKYNFYLQCPSKYCNKAGSNGYIASDYLGIVMFMKTIGFEVSSSSEDGICPGYNRCKAAQESFALAVEQHNEKCPDHQVTGQPSFACTSIFEDDGVRLCGKGDIL